MALSVSFIVEEEECESLDEEARDLIRAADASCSRHQSIVSIKCQYHFIIYIASFAILDLT